MTTQVRPGEVGFDPLTAATVRRPRPAPPRAAPPRPDARSDRPVAVPLPRPRPESSVGLTTALIGPRQSRPVRDATNARTVLPGVPRQWSVPVPPALPPHALPPGRARDWRRRARWWGTALLAVLLLAGAYGVTLLQRQYPTINGSVTVDGATVAKGATAAWSASAPEGTEISAVTQGPDDTVLVTSTARASDDSSAAAQVAAYDGEGEQVWAASYDGLRATELVTAASVVVVLAGDGLHVLGAEDGAELWSRDDVHDARTVSGGLLVGLGDADAPRLALLDTTTGERRLTVAGDLVGTPSDAGFLVRDDGRLVRYDDAGERIWSADPRRLGLRDDLLTSAETDGLIALSSSEAGLLVALDAETGSRVWREDGDFALLRSAPAGTIGALRSEHAAAPSGDPRSTYLVLFDADGERDRADLGRLAPWAKVAYVEAGGRQRLVSLDNGVVLDNDLNPVAEHYAPVAGMSVDGLYLRDGARLSVADWESEDVLYTITLDDAEGPFWALDGAVATASSDATTVTVYR